MAIKMYAIFSKESVAKMKGNKGKMCAQAGHAYLHAWWAAERLQAELKWGAQRFENTNEHFTKFCDLLHEYKHAGDARKIALLAETDEEMLTILAKYKGHTGVTIVEDCGYTVVEPGTMTCVGIGPIDDKDKCDELRALPLFLT